MSWQIGFSRILTLITALAACQAARAAEWWFAATAAQILQAPRRVCPSHADRDALLGHASDLMAQARFQDAASLLLPLSDNGCDPRVSLLLAAADEGQKDVHSATQVLQQAHLRWPLNTSIAASLAREYLVAGDSGDAVRALAHFHATAETPEQEMEMAVVVYLAAHQLAAAQTVSEVNYKAHPSVHTLLLLANALQLQGRYPDVNRLLGSKRVMYADSPEFFVTLAESEFDASIYPAARDDLERAISLRPEFYQAHYLLGNVLFKLNDADGAVAEYRKAIDLAPEQPRTYYQLALLLESRQDESGEQHALEQAIAADDHYAPAHCEIGRLLLESHRPGDAVSHLLAAVQYNPRSEKAYFLLARAYSELGDKDKSAQTVKRLQVVRAENRPGAHMEGDEKSSGSEPLPGP